MSNENGLYYALNPGAMLRKLFPKQLNTQALILIWAIIFALNIIVVVLIQNFAIYKIADVSQEGISKVAYFDNCEITKIHKDINVDRYRKICYVKYVNESKEERIVCLEKFPDDAFNRYRVKKETDCAVDEDGLVVFDDGSKQTKVMVQEYVKVANPTSAFSLLILDQFYKKLIAIYIACGVVLLGIEFFFYSVFHRLFRS